MSRDAVPCATRCLFCLETPREGVPLFGETEAFMPSFRPFAHKALFGSYYANVFWTFIVPKKFRGFDQTTLAIC
jgi:hypothetical protein